MKTINVRKMLLLLSVLVMALAFCSCGKKGTTSSTKEASAEASEDAEENAEEEIIEGEYRQVHLPDGTDLELADDEAYLNGLIYLVDRDAKVATVSYPVDYELKEAVIPDTIDFDHGTYPVTGIGESALSGLDELKSVKLGENVEYIESDAFYGDTKLATFTAGSGLKSIGDNAVAGCDELTTVELNEGLESIGTDAFSSNPALKSISIPSTVTSFGETVFMDCETLSKVELPEGVSGLGNGLFTNCYELSDIKIPSSVTEIPLECFYSCESLTGRFDIPDSVKKVGTDAFYNTGLSELRVPANLREVDESTFDGIDDLKTLYVSPSEANKYKKLYDGYDFKVATY